MPVVAVYWVPHAPYFRNEPERRDGDRAFSYRLDLLIAESRMV